MEKIQAGSSEFVNGRDSILIDLSSWYRDTLPPKIGLIQDAIELRRRIRFDYYSPGGDTKREIEPYYLIFKWSSWYVYGFCLLRKDFRLFKLNRMDSIIHGEVFDRRSEIPLPELSNEKVFPASGRVKAVFDPSMKWQLVEEYGVGSFEEQPDGTLLFEHEYSDDEGLISWMLSCRDKVKHIRRPWKKERHPCWNQSLSLGDREPAILQIRRGILLRSVPGISHTKQKT